MNAADVRTFVRYEIELMQVVDPATINAAVRREFDLQTRAEQAAARRVVEEVVACLQTDSEWCPTCEMLVLPEGQLRADGLVNVCPRCGTETVVACLGPNGSVTVGEDGWRVEAWG